MPNKVLDKILLLDKHWSLIGTKKYPHRRIKEKALKELRNDVGTVHLPLTANLCRGARRGGKSFDGKLNHPALWFAYDSTLCQVEKRERIYFYRPKKKLTLLDLRETDKQSGYENAEKAFDILYGEEGEYDYQRDSIVPAMLYRKVDEAGIHGWIAYDDKEELEVMLLNPKKYLKQKFDGKPHKRLPRKKRFLSDGRDTNVYDKKNAAL